MFKDNLQTEWHLNPLFKSDDDPEIERLRKKVIKSTDKFVNEWKNRNDYLTDSATLKIALDEYNLWLTYFGALQQESYYYHLRFSLNQNDPQIKAKMGKSEELSKNIENDMQFFELNLAKVKKNNQKKFLTNLPLKTYKHFLEKIFSLSPHLLSESEEKILNLKSTTSYSNWVKMTSGFLSKETVEVLDESGKVTTKSFSELLGLINSQNKKVRDKAAFEFNSILKKHSEVAEAELNSVLQDKKVNDNLRNYKFPQSGRLLHDDIDNEVVDNLKNAVDSQLETAKKFYSLKAKLLDVKKLEYHERNVEYSGIDKSYSYNYGIKIIKETFENLDKEFADIFSGFIKNGQIDAYPKKGKAGGAFCTYGLITHPTYILLNWNNKLNDVLTLAHELGHGINNELIKKAQVAINFGTPTSTAEVASTFMEDFVLQKLLQKANDEEKLAIYMMKLNEEISTIFRQIAFFNFESELHHSFRNKGYLSKEEIGKLFQKHMVSYMGPAVKQSEGSENWWIYVNHFRYYFYVYSYASGLLISKSLQAEVKENPEFIEKVKAFLSTGLADSPKNIFAKLGIDITDRNFWGKGLTEVEHMLTKTEKLAKKLGKI